MQHASTSVFSSLLLLLSFLAATLRATPVASSSSSSTSTTKTPHYLDITAIYTNPQNNSAFQCWRFLNPFNVSSTAGTNGAAVLALGDITDASITVIPAGFDGGVHRAPVPQ